MGLDIRIPLGLVFLIIGGIMAVFGIFTHGDTALYEKSLGVDINLLWGGIMFAFGAIMFFFGRRQKWQDDPVSPRPWERESADKPRH
jgi:hypothetical protein